MSSKDKLIKTKKMPTKKTILFFISVILLINSCKNDSNSTMFMPNCTGVMGEVLIVMEDNRWDGAMGDTIFSYFGMPHPMFLQNESFFKVTQIPHEAFTNIFETHRNIIFTNIRSDIKESSITITSDKWSIPQLIINMNAHDDLAFKELFDKNKKFLMDTIHKAEIKRYQNISKKYSETTITEYLQQNHNLSVIFPKGYKLDVDKDNFIWISYETPRTTQAVFIYYYNYVDTNTFTAQYLVAKRDSFLRKHVPGPTDGSYMTTEKLVPVLLKEYKIDDKYTCEMRGLWRTEGAFLGGPFISISQVDETRNRVVTCEGFIYAGKLDKKIYFWQIESIIKTFKIL